MKINIIDSDFKNKRINLRDTAIEVFLRVFEKINPLFAIQNAVKIQDSTLYICNETFDLENYPEIYVVSFGKAAFPMAVGLNQILAEKIITGVVSAPKTKNFLPSQWKVFAGGHPVPNEESIYSARAVIDLLKRANHKKSIIIFLISGGGSSMLELPKDENISFEDLQKTNKILINCGAKINEINKLRRAISQIKGGGLAKIAPKARQVSLIISDTNSGDFANVASGPTIVQFNKERIKDELNEIIEKYNLQEKLPSSIVDFLNRIDNKNLITEKGQFKTSFHTLLENKIAVESIAKWTQNLGLETLISDDLIENSIAEGCFELVNRLLKLKDRNRGKPVAVISGGEFVCPVRGTGIGGRNLETVLRCLIEIEKVKTENLEYAILSCGTDGIDGNSNVAGAVADQTSLRRAKELGLDPVRFLHNSDSYSFFQTLEDTIKTGATGTNVRDIRILLAF